MPFLKLAQWWPGNTASHQITARHSSTRRIRVHGRHSPPNFSVWVTFNSSTESFCNMPGHMPRLCGRKISKNISWLQWRNKLSKFGPKVLAWVLLWCFSWSGLWDLCVFNALAVKPAKNIWMVGVCKLYMDTIRMWRDMRHCETQFCHRMSPPLSQSTQNLPLTWPASRKGMVEASNFVDPWPSTSKNFQHNPA